MNNDRIVELIELLTADDGSSLEILCPNADFNGQPDRAIEVTDSWTEWEPKRFGANTLLECLEAAMTAKQAAENQAKLVEHYGHLGEPKET